MPERHQVSVDRRMSVLPRRWAADPPPRPAAPAPEPEPVIEAVPVEPVEEPAHTPGEPMTVAQLRTIVGIDLARKGDDAVIYGTVDGHGRLVLITAGMEPGNRETPQGRVDALPVREPEKPTTVVLEEDPQEDLAAQLRRGLFAQGDRLTRPGTSVPRR